MKNTVKILAVTTCMAICFLFINFTVYQPSSIYITGAVADGKTDDRVAVQNAMNSAMSGQKCVDGQNKTYGINGSLTASKNFCLKNARFIQLHKPLDTTPYIKCNVSDCYRYDLVAESYYPTGGPTLSGSVLDQILKDRSVRTFLIRGTTSAPIKVSLENIYVNKGLYGELGSPSDAAGIWISAAKEVSLNKIEITGKGHGPGLHMDHVTDVVLRNLNIHDLTWSPYKGDRPLKESAVTGHWNGVPIFDYYKNLNQFVQVRVQERIGGIIVTDADNLLVQDSKISGIGTQFDTGFIPWQADGFTLGSGTRNVTMKNISVSNVWEGIDLVGKPSDSTGDRFHNHVYSGLTISDIFAFGVKVGYEAEEITVKSSSISYAGYAGVVVYGEASHVGLEGVQIKESGLFNNHGRLLSPWTGADLVGVLVFSGGSNVSIINSSSANIAHPQSCNYGFLRRYDAGYTSSYNTSVTGCRLGKTSGISSGNGTSLSNATGATVSITTAGGSSCSLGGATILNGSSIKAYQQGSLPAGYSCDALSQIRTCNNGVLSGTYQNLTCKVETAKSCTLGGVTILSGKSIKAYWQGSLPAGYSCDTWSQIRTCNNGVLSGTYMNLSCRIEN
jgi:hypothetical protein